MFELIFFFALAINDGSAAADAPLDPTAVISPCPPPSPPVCFTDPEGNQVCYPVDQPCEDSTKPGW